MSGKTQITSSATDGNVLKIGSTSQTSGDVVYIEGTPSQNALKVYAGNTVLNGDFQINQVLSNKLERNEKLLMLFIK